MNSLKTIAMTGFMGSGKSAIGARLADQFKIPFRDLDKMIEQGEQRLITDIFRDSGETYFRKIERNYFEKAVLESPLILALGGGAMQQPEIGDYLKAHAITVYLDVPVKTLFERLRKCQNRPLLHDKSGKLLNAEALMHRISRLLAEREPVYRRADITVIVQPEWTQEQTTKQLIKQLESHASTAITEDS